MADYLYNYFVYHIPESTLRPNPLEAILGNEWRFDDPGC